MPGRPGHWDLLAVAMWRLARLRKPQTGGNGNGALPTNPRQRREHFQAERERLKYETETRQLISIDEHERALTMRSGWIVTVLDTLPGIFAPLVAGKTVAESQRVMQQTCRKLRQQAYGDAET